LGRLDHAAERRQDLLIAIANRGTTLVVSRFFTTLLCLGYEAGEAAVSISYADVSIFRSVAQSCAGFWRMQMTLFNWHADGVDGRFPFTRAVVWATATLKAFHRAIVAAKLHRLKYELMFHAGAGDSDGEKFPQQPMLLGDKWDF
jgi:hypothetical protein